MHCTLIQLNTVEIKVGMSVPVGGMWGVTSVSKYSSVRHQGCYGTARKCLCPILQQNNWRE